MNSLPVELKDKIFSYVDHCTLQQTRELQSEYTKHKTKYKSYYTCIVSADGTLDNLKWIYENDLDEFNTFIYEKAIKFCNFQTVHWFWSIGGKNFRSNINVAIEAGRSVETLEKFHTELGFQLDTYTRFTVENNCDDINVFRWTVSKGVVFNEISAMNVIRSTSKGPKTIEKGKKILDYLVKELGVELGPNSFFVASVANKEGCVEFMRYIYNLNKEMVQLSLSQEIIRIGFLVDCHLRILKLIHEEMYQFSLYDAVYSNRIHFLKWIYPKVIVDNFDTTFTLFNNSRLDIIEFLINEGHRFKQDATDAAITSVCSLEILKYLYFTLDLPFNEDSTYKVCCWLETLSSNKLDTLIFLYNIGANFDHRCVSKIIERGEIMILRFLLDVVGLVMNEEEAMEVEEW